MMMRMGTTHPVARCCATMLLLLVMGVAVAIYPDHHWNYATQLTEANFDTFVQDNIQAGKTVFVRWIASP